jgi:hypothetical protein
MRTLTTCILLGSAIVSGTVQADDKWDIDKFDLTKLPPAADTQGVTYAKDIRPLFEASCLRCHGEQRDKGDLRLDSLQAALKGGEDGKVIVPGESKKSLLIVAAAQIDNDTAMPPKHGPGGHSPGGPGGPGGPPPDGGPGGPPPNGHGGPGGPGGFGPPSKALTAEQVSLIRAWIDQGAK